MKLNEYGEIANAVWRKIPNHFPNAELDEYIIMPNHVHGIIVIDDRNGTAEGHNIKTNNYDEINAGAGLAPAQYYLKNLAQNDINDHLTNDKRVTENKRATNIEKNRATARVAPTIGDIVGAFKSIVSNECLKIFKTNNRRMRKFWQRNYYDRILRDDIELNIKREYIINNPARWNEDENNPAVYKNISKD